MNRKVWLIYQGKKGKEETEKYISEFNKEQYRGYLTLHKTEYNYDDFRENIYTRIKNDVRICDAAIAVLTEDNRKASEAGNLWFEIGYWLAVKPPETLLISHEKNINPYLISDIVGHSTPSFILGTQDLIKTILEHLMTLLINNQKDDTNNAQTKIQDIFGAEDNPLWLDPSSYYCDNINSSCPFREASLEFCAENIKIGFEERLKSLLGYIYFNISLILNDLVYLKQIEHLSEDDHYHEINPRLSKLIDNLESLNVFPSEIIVLARFSQVQIEKESIYSFLSKYINKRLQYVLDNFNSLETKSIIYADINSYIKINQTEKFMQWAKRIKNNFNLISKKDFKLEISSSMAELDEMREYCKSICEVLEITSNYYNKNCIQLPIESIRAFKNPRSIDTKLSELCKEFPHNKNNYINIWSKI